MKMAWGKGRRAESRALRETCQGMKYLAESGKKRLRKGEIRPTPDSYRDCGPTNVGVDGYGRQGGRNKLIFGIYSMRNAEMSRQSNYPGGVTLL